MFPTTPAANPPTTTFETAKGLYQGRQCNVLRQRENCNLGATLVTRGGNLPAY